ncbi:MAG: DNA translocase FtsK 4TM domain-containing protein [Myxococcales bacterium]|nr:DNA translocase FtsK 4TM domain-containing protein [Myxococcales bacterium]MCB9552517.1 DNA translocase FtsK 4TM domain-containing protein [Myxococcales bacterium]
MAAEAQVTSARTNKRGKARAPATEAAPRRRASDFEADALRNEVLGIAVMALAVCLMLALGSFHPEDVAPDGPAATTGRAHNLIGPVGASIADVLLGIFGVAAFLLPVTFAAPGVCFMTGRRVRVRVTDAIGYPVLVLCSAMAAHLWMAGRFVLGHDAGGLIGTHGAEILQALFGLTGAYIIIYALMALTFVLTTRISLVRIFHRVGRPVARAGKTAADGAAETAVGLGSGLGERFGAWRQAMADARAARRAERVARKVERAAAREAARQARVRAAEARAAAAQAEDEAEGAEDEAAVEPEAVESAPRPKVRLRGRKVKEEPAPAAEVERSGEFTLGAVAVADGDDGYVLGGGAPAVAEAPRFGAAAEDADDADEDDADEVFDAAEVAELDDPLDREAFEDEGDTVMAESIAAFEAEHAAAAPKPKAPAAEAAGEEEKPVVKARRANEKPPEDELDIPLPELERYESYQLPPLRFLDYDASSQVEVDPAFLQQQADRLVEALNTFRIEGRVTEIHPGPVVTMFEFEPAPGVRISKIASLADDLAMSLKAVRVRIVAPIPGKGVVGFEVPNKKREMVFLKEIIGSQVFRNRKHQLPMALGKDIHGAPVVTDLAKMPHLLVAGTTGSGKSVGVNGMITSLLYFSTPEEVRFIMVDPKMLELSIYEGIPHLLLPVVTDAKKASMALKWAVDEMERRYEMMKDAGVRDLRGYNKKIEKAVAEAEAAALRKRAELVVAAANDDDGEDDEAGTQYLFDDGLDDLPSKLPYIVVVIDEFADLMMVAGKEVEYCVARIAQKARAAGIHLILATQRPSTDVITGVIKANFPTRIAFQVSSAIDSRTILSTNGAEALLGKGDMLYMPPGTSRLDRVHGAFVSEEEIHQVVEYIARQGEPDYLDESVLLDPEEMDEEELDEGESDPMYEEAVRTVARDGRASTSHLQRRLSLGYNRAARIIDLMERDGLVGPGRGAKPRQINRAALTELVARWDGDFDGVGAA